jgi:hypothetical protein
MRIALIALLGSLTVSAAAQAQDACLTGDSTLADQRAFAALDAATETVCPCDAAASAKTYQALRQASAERHARQ